MPSEPDPRPPRPPRRPWRRRLVLALVLLAIATALVISRSSVLGPGLIRLAGERLERVTGCQVEVERVSGSWYDGLVLEGLEMIARREGTPLRYLRGRAHAGYSLIGLAFGRENALRSLDLELERVVLDLAGDGGEAGPGPTPPRLFPPGTWHVREAQILLPGSRKLELVELHATLDRARGATRVEREPGQRLGLDLPRLSLLQQDELLWEGPASLRGVYRAGLVELASLDFRSTVDDTSGGVRQGRLDLRGLPEHSVAFRLPLDTLGGIVQLEGRMRGRAWQLRLGARDLALDPLASLAARLVPGDWVEAWPGGRLEASLSLRFELLAGEAPVEPPRGDVVLRLSDGYALGHPCDQLFARAAFDEDGLRVEELELVGPVLAGSLREALLFETDTPLRVSRETWPLPDVPRDIRMGGAFDVSLYDLPAFLAGPIATHFRLAELLPDPLEPLSGCAAMTGSLSGTWADARVELDIEGHALATEDVPWGALEARIEAQREQLSLPYLRLDGPLVSAVGALEFPAPGDGWIWMAGRVLDMRHLATLIERWGPDLPLVGEAEFELDWRRALTYGHLDLCARSERFEWGSTEVRELDARVTGDPWALVFERLRVVLDRSAGEGTARLPHGPVQVIARPEHALAVRRDEAERWNVESAGLELEADGRRLELAGPSALRYDFTNHEFATSHSAWAAGRGRLELSGRREGGELSAQLGFVEFDSEPWLAPFLPQGASLGVLDGGATLSLRSEATHAPRTGATHAPRTGATHPLRTEATHPLNDNLAAGARTLTDLETHGLRWPGLPASRAWLRVHQFGEELELELLELQAPELGSLRVTGRTRFDSRAPLAGLARQPSELSFEARLDDPRPLWNWIPRERLPVDFAAVGTLRARGTLRGDGRELGGSFKFEGDELYASGGPAGERAIFGPARIGANVDLDAQGVWLVEGRFDSPELRAQARARTFGALLQDPAAWPAYWRDVRTEESASLEVADLTWLAAWLPTVRRTSGSLSAALPPRAERRPDAPYGRIFLADGLVRFRGTELFAQSLSGELRLDQRRLVVHGLEGEFGAARVRVSGSVDVAQPEPVFDIELDADDLLLARSRGLRIRADTGGQDGAGLRIVGPLHALEVSGRLALSSSLFTRQYDILGWLSRREKNAPEAGEGIRLRLAEDGPLADMKLDVEISGGDPFRIDTNLVDGSLRPDLRLQGTGRLAFLQGPIYIDPSRINLPSGGLDVTGGTVLFGEENPFVPRLDISAEQRIRGYDIKVAVSGTTHEPEITISSNPPLPGDDVFVLLLTGQIPRGSWGDRTERAGQVLALYLAKDALVRAFGGEGSGESALDRLELTMGQDVSRQGIETMHMSYRLGPRPRGKGVSNYLTAERDEYDKENFGFRVLFRFR